MRIDSELQSLNFQRVFSATDLARYEEMFKYFDRTGRGYITREDLPTAIRALGFLVTTFELRDLASYLDQSRTNKYSLKQFLTGVYAVKDRKPDKNEIYKSLQVFDRNGSGKIHIESLRKILTEIGDIVDDNEFYTVFAELENADDYVSIDELVEILTYY
jgi:Ca2+-binding EF-hand superfamily protein